MCEYYHGFLFVSKISYWCQADAFVWSLSDHRTRVLWERKAAKILMIFLMTKFSFPFFQKCSILF